MHGCSLETAHLLNRAYLINNQSEEVLAGCIINSAIREFLFFKWIVSGLVRYLVTEESGR